MRKYGTRVQSKMSNRTTFALFVALVVAVVFLAGGYWRATTDRLVLREQIRDQVKIAATAEMKLSNAADQFKKQLEETKGQIETIAHEKGELEHKLQDQSQMKKEKEALNEKLDAVIELNDQLKKEADTANNDRNKLDDEVQSLKSKVTNLGQTLNDTLTKQETQAKQLLQKEEELQKRIMADGAAAVKAADTRQETGVAVKPDKTNQG